MAVNERSGQANIEYSRPLEEPDGIREDTTLPRFRTVRHPEGEK